MADIHNRIVTAGYFAGLGPDEFAGGADPILDLTRLDRPAWLGASRRSNTGDYAAMTRCIRDALI